jgi:uncharacterized membrane protein
VLEWLQTTGYSEWVRESWGWAFALTIHAFGNATVVGLMFIMGLRLFGFFKTIPYTSLNRLFPFIWIAVVFQFLSGFTLFMSKPPRYVRDGVFDIKFTLVIVGVALTIYFQQMLKKDAANWQAAGKVTSKGVRLAAIACIVWAFVIVMGRLTAYLGSLYIS